MGADWVQYRRELDNCSVSYGMAFPTNKLEVTLMNSAWAGMGVSS